MSFVIIECRSGQWRIECSMAKIDRKLVPVRTLKLSFTLAPFLCQLICRFIICARGSSSTYEYEVFIVNERCKTARMPSFSPGKVTSH